MNLNRREAMVTGAAGMALALVPAAVLAQDAAEAPEQTADEAIAEFADGAEVVEGEGITLTAPEIAENGNTVPVSVDAPGAAEIMLIATGNPTAGVARFKFGEASGAQMASTRIRLAKTQDIIALAKMTDGSVVRTASNIKVTIGGCGG